MRDSLGLTGTKFSCGIGQCGACTPVSLAVGKPIKPIEGVAADGLHPVQRA